MSVIRRLELSTLMVVTVIGVVAAAYRPVAAQDTVQNARSAGDAATDSRQEVTPPTEFDDDFGAIEAPQLPPPKDAKALPHPDRVWVDVKRRQVYVDGFVSLREGYLEMFACTEGTKEHESVVAVRSRAFVVHAALLSVGAESGRPVQFRPEYKPPTGTEIEIEVRWIDEQGKWRQARAQDWVLNVDTEKPMSEPWVFAGSGFYTDETTGKRYYMAEGGDFICVSNFTTAMLDIPIESSQQNDGLLFKANTDRIPPLGLPVRLVLKSKLDDQTRPSAGDREGQRTESAAVGGTP